MRYAYWYDFGLQQLQRVLRVCARLGTDEKLLADDNGRRPVCVMRIERRDVEGDIERVVQRNRQSRSKEA